MDSNKKKLFEYILGGLADEDMIYIIGRLEEMVSNDIPDLTRGQVLSIHQAIKELAASGNRKIIAIMPVATYINSCR